MTEAGPSPDAEAKLEKNQAEDRTPGSMIHEARTRLGYTLDDLARETRLFKSALHQLELDEYGQLSQPALAVGYYRQCARALDLDEECVIAAYYARLKAIGGLPESQTLGSIGCKPADVTPSNQSRLPRGLLVIVLIFALVVAAVAILLPSVSLPDGSGDSSPSALQSSETGDPSDTLIVQSGGQTSASNNKTTAASTPSEPDDKVASPAAMAGADKAEGNGSKQPKTAGNATDQAADVRAGQRDAPNQMGRLIDSKPGGRQVASVFDNGQSDTGAGHAAPKNENRRSDRGQADSTVPPDRLKLDFEDKSWVRVTDSAGNQLDQGIFKAGDTRVFNNNAPYNVTLGYAPGVDVSIGGQPFAVSDTRNNGVAHITVAARTNEQADG